MASDRFEEMVEESLRLVRTMTRCQFAVGDMALELEPLRDHGGHLPLEGEHPQGVEASLRLFAESIGLSFHTVRTYRWVAAHWPVEERQEGVSFEVHRILAGASDAFEVIRNPPLNEHTGERRWNGDAAKRAMGWKTDIPVTTQEKVAVIRDLAEDESVAAQAACDLLRRPEVAFKAMRDRDARSAVNQAQFDQAEFVEEGFEEELGEDGEDDGIDDPVRIVHGFRRAMEFTDLIGICQGFVAGASRLVPRLRGQEFTGTQLQLVETQLEKIRATCDWIESAVATGKVDLDEALAQLLRDK
ncbi:DUF6192 family protein [Streptomyces sp. NPDC050523]|uniref:DUF6192 family protein n=1 Tax=Streptomyces sp. NPDC050523 TaxID=3365622 RepID=UPI0037AF82F8